MTSTATASATFTFDAAGLYAVLVPSTNEVNTFLDGTCRYRVNGGEWLDGAALVDTSATYTLKNPYFLDNTAGVPNNWALHNSATLSGNTIVLVYSGGESAVRQALTGTFNGAFRCWVRLTNIASGGCEVRVTNGTYPGPTVYMTQSITTSLLLGGKDLFVDFALSNVTNPTVEVRVANSGDSVTVEWVLFGPAGIAATSLLGLRPDNSIDVEMDWIRRNRGNNSIIEQGSASLSGTTRPESFPGQTAGSRTWYLSPDPDGDEEGDGSAQSPWFSIGHASLSAAPGDTILMANGAYRYSLTNERRIPNRPGSTNAYITVRPADTANPNVVITEAGTISASWEAYSASGPYASGIYRTTAAFTSLLNIVRDTTTGDVLYTYRAINDMSGVGSTRYGIADHPEPGWFLEKDGGGTGVNLLYVKLASGQAPTTGQLTAAMGVAGGLSFQGSSYWKIRGITFRDFGTIEWVGTAGDYQNENRGAIGVATGSDNCVVEHCTFDNAMLSLGQSGTGVTGGHGTLIRRNLFVAQSGWDMIYRCSCRHKHVSILNEESSPWRTAFGSRRPCLCA